MLKKLFDWSPLDIAYWEQLRQKGLPRFIAWYGILISGGLMFLLSLLGVGFIWIKQAVDTGLTRGSWISLLVQLIFFALLSVFVGILTSVVTWVVEERLYRKYKARNEDN